MNDDQLKAKFKQMMDEEFTKIPSFEDIAPPIPINKQGLLVRYLKPVAAALLLGILSYWMVSRQSSSLDQTSTNLVQWEAPTDLLVLPIAAESKLYTWQSPTDFLIPNMSKD